MRKGAAVAGILIAIVAVLVTIGLDHQGTKERGRIERGLHNMTNEVRDHLVRVRLAVSEARAHAAEGNGDYVHYTSHGRGKVDIADLVELATYSTAVKEPSLAYLQEQLLVVYSDYESCIEDMPSLPREQRRLRGIILSHRRQMGVLIAAIRGSEPSAELLTLVNRIERELNVG